MSEKKDLKKRTRRSRNKKNSISEEIPVKCIKIEDCNETISRNSSGTFKIKIEDEHISDKIDNEPLKTEISKTKKAKSNKKKERKVKNDSAGKLKKKNKVDASQASCSDEDRSAEESTSINGLETEYYIGGVADVISGQTTEDKVVLKLHTAEESETESDEDSETDNDPPTATVFVRNLPVVKHSHTLGEKLENHFSGFGKVKSVLVENKRHVFNAFITFETIEDATEALKANCTTFLGNLLFVSRLKSRPQPKNQIHVGGLSYGTQAIDLWEIFKECGEVAHIFMPFQKSYAFVEFKSKKSVALAFQMKDVKINNKPIQIGQSLSLEERKMMYPNAFQNQNHFNNGPQQRGNFHNGPQNHFNNRPQYNRNFNNNRFNNGPQNRFNNGPQNQFNNGPQRNFVNRPQSETNANKPQKKRKHGQVSEQFQGTKFTDKAKKPKANKESIKKKKLGKILTTKTEAE